MPVDPALVDSMLKPFRDMLADMRQKELDGPDIDTMAEALEEMERQAATASDAGALGQTLAGSGLYQEFSDAYSRTALAAASGPGAGGGLPSDEGLLAQTLAGYRASEEQLRGQPEEARLVAPLREAIELGESGVSYPVFLRLLIERGLDQAMAGAIVSRDAIVAALEHERSVVDPAREAMHAAILDAHDDLRSRSAFGAVDPFEFDLVQWRLRWEHEPGIAARDALVLRWGRLMELVVDWLDSHCSFASGDDRWASPSAPSETQRNIERTQECNPGFLAVREALVTETWGLRFEDVFAHESYASERRGGRVPYTEVRVELARATRPHCVPGGSPPPPLVTHAEELYRSGSWWEPAARGA